MSELAEVRARASVPEARIKSFSGFFFIGVVVEMFGWVVERGHRLVGKLRNTLLGSTAMVSIQTIWSMEIRANWN